MINDDQLRQTLINSCHSSAVAREYFESHLDDAELLRRLVLIAQDEDGYLGDAPMEAAHRISEFPANLLVPYEKELIAMLQNVDASPGAVAVAIGKIKSIAGKAPIVEQLGDGTRFDAWLFQKALSYYES